VENAGEAMVNSTTIVADRAQMSDYLARCGSWAALPLVVQEYLPEQDCEDWFFHGCVGENPRGDAAFRLSFTGRKIRSYPLGAGLTTMGRACDNPELRRVAEKFLVGVGYRGIVDLDVRLDRRTNAYHLLDANPRPGAQFAVARRADGIDAARALYLELTGRPLPPQVAQSSGHAICVENFDAVSVARLLLQRRLSPREWLRSMREGPVEWAWFDRDDLLPWIVMWSRFLWCRIVPRLMPRPSGPRAAGHTWPVQLNRLGRVRPVTAPDSTERPAAAPRIFDGSRRRLRTGAAVLLVRPDAGGACETRAPRRGVES
jgi:predicted ATP-grasp superfamily ATP-dependent carboligase